jgi:hypothetical protein
MTAPFESIDESVVVDGKLAFEGGAPHGPVVFPLK